MHACVSALSYWSNVASNDGCHVLSCCAVVVAAATQPVMLVRVVLVLGTVRPGNASVESAHSWPHAPMASGTLQQRVHKTVVSCATGSVALEGPVELQETVSATRAPMGSALMLLLAVTTGGTALRQT